MEDLLQDLLAEARDRPLVLPVKPHTARLSSGERGFTLDFLRAFCRFCDADTLSMAEVCKSPTFASNVCQLTSSTGLSLVESCILVAKRKGIDTHTVFGPATTFFSYSWEGTTLQDMLSAIETTGLEGRFFW